MISVDAVRFVTEPRPQSGLYLLCPKHNVYAANRKQPCMRCLEEKHNG